MATLQLNRLSRKLHQAVEDRRWQTTTDAELLETFQSGDDSSVFEAIVRRHGPRVLAACRKVLNSAADVEDVFQATFLVFLREGSRIRQRQSLGGWLYGVAHRLALQARSRSARRSRLEGKKIMAESSEAPDVSWTEACAILHEELDRLPDTYRLPLLLCYLEGKSRDEAAELVGCTPSALHGRLERGRDRLRNRLTKRGITLSAGLLATVMNSVTAGGPPEHLISAILTAATTGRFAASVATLVHGATISMIYGKLKMLMVPLLVVGLITVGVSVKMSAATEPPAPPKKEIPAQEAKKAIKTNEAEEAEVSGLVLDPEGKPVSGATIVVPNTNNYENTMPLEIAKTDEAGKFHAKLKPKKPGEPEWRNLVARAAGFGADWITISEIENKSVTFRLVPDDVVVHGRVTDLQGRPVPEAKITIKALQTTQNGSLDEVFKQWKSDPYLALMSARKELHTPTCAGLPDHVKSNKEGNFEIKGAGRGRMLNLRIEGNGIESAGVRVVVLPKFDPMTVHPKGLPGHARMMVRPAPDLYGPDFTHAGKPDAIISGLITDSKTGKPLAGIQVSGSADQGWWENNSTTKTDKDGQYKLTGIAKAPARRLLVWPGENSSYLQAGQIVRDAAGLTESTVNFALVRGVVVTGRVTDKATGEPIQGAGVFYTPLADNKYYATTPGTDAFRLAKGAQTTKADGSFRMVVLPGVGLITAQGETRGKVYRVQYKQVRLDPADEPRTYKDPNQTFGEAFIAADGHIEMLRSQSAYKLIDPDEDAESLKVELQFEPGDAVSGKVVDAEGKPIDGVLAFGLTAVYDRPTKLKNGEFTAIALDAKKPRTLAFIDTDRKLAGAVQLLGTEKEGPVVKMTPWGAATGQILDGDKKPMAKVEVKLLVQPNDQQSCYRSAVSGINATTDAEGRFRIDVPFGDVEFDLLFSRDGSYLERGKTPVVKKVAAGKTIDLGMMELKGEEE